tara:strand:+ start:263 stop:757 length:495 start_codon:yes stop_codon:yes gene_type:complete
MKDKKTIFIISSDWYLDYISSMEKAALSILDKKKPIFEFKRFSVPGSLEIAPFAKHVLNEYKHPFNSPVGIFCLGIVIRGQTSHYDLVSNEVFRSIGELSMTFPNIAVINNVLCVENEAQLKGRLIKNTKSNARGMIRLIKEKKLAINKESFGLNVLKTNLDKL